MLFEKQEDIQFRVNAARRWLKDYADYCRNADNQPQASTDRALMVIVLDEKTSDYLAEHDPQALKQAQLALNKKSWEDYRFRQPR